MSKTPLKRDLHLKVAGTKSVRIRKGFSPGENGVSVEGASLLGRALIRVTSPDHWLAFSLDGRTRIDCRIADRRLFHTLQPGSMALVPAGADASAEIEGPVEHLMVRINPKRIAVAAAERGCMSAGLVDRLSGRDERLLQLAGSLFAEARDGYVNGPLFWNEAADRIVDHLIENHLNAKAGTVGGSLPAATVARLADYIRLHIADPLDVASLAGIAGVSRYHFTRLFTRSVGMTPHRYVTKLRLDEATRLVRQRHLPLAEVALATGFADQSHLSRWAKRVHGTTLSRIAA